MTAGECSLGTLAGRLVAKSAVVVAWLFACSGTATEPDIKAPRVAEPTPEDRSGLRTVALPEAVRPIREIVWGGDELICVSNWQIGVVDRASGAYRTLVAEDTLFSHHAIYDARRATLYVLQLFPRLSEDGQPIGGGSSN